LSSESLRIPKTTIEKLFDTLRYDSRSKKWKGKTEGSKKTGLSRPTIDKILSKYPHGLPSKPQLGQPKYVDVFEQTEAWQRLKDHKYADLIHGALLTAWKLLGKREPIEWTDQDIRDLRKPTVTRKGVTQDNTLFISLTKDIAPENATQLRRAFKGLSLYMLEKPLEDVPKRPFGSRQQWYLENSDIIKLFQGCLDVETLLFVVLGIQCGARPISMIEIKVSDITWEKNYIHYYESKRKMFVPRFFIPATMTLLKRYVSDLGLAVNQRLLKENQDHYTKKLKDIGFAQDINLLKTEGAGAYVLRHTFATQASEHDVSMEVVMKQGGWKDASTLMNHYMFVKSSKMQRELLGVIVEKPLNFGDWIKQFVPYWEKRYEEIRPQIKRAA